MQFIDLCYISLLGMGLLLSGCGSSSGDASTTINDTTQSVATAQLGNLANAEVFIYQVDLNGSLQLRWQERTSSGDSLDEIGKFNSHANEVDTDSLYLYKVIGGEDWDSNDDGILDTNATTNKGTIRLFAEGTDIITMGNELRVTLVSELVYEKVYTKLHHFNMTLFTSELSSAAQTIITDVNEDGSIDYRDVLTYDPVNNKEKLKEIFRIKQTELLSFVHAGGAALFMPGLFTYASFDTERYTFNVTLSADEKTAFVADYANGVVILDLSLL